MATWPITHYDTQILIYCIIIVSAHCYKHKLLKLKLIYAKLNLPSESFTRFCVVRNAYTVQLQTLNICILLFLLSKQELHMVGLHLIRLYSHL